MLIYALFASAFLHVPVGSAPEGQPLRIVGRMARDASVVVHYRAAAARESTPAWNEASPVRTPSGEFAVDLPARAVQPPGLEYYIEADGAPAFASADEPYFVTVAATEESLLASSALRANDGRRSRARVQGEYVDFGSRGDFSDRYFRLEGDYSYSLYRAVYTIRIGGGLLRASTFQGDLASGSATAEQPGLDYGYAEIRFRLAENVFLDTRGLLGATEVGFQAGGGGAVLLGKPETVYVALGGEVMGRIGAEAFLRLHWDTIPTVPMSATIALSDFPGHERPTGVRLVVDASHPVGPVTLTAKLGYQARDTEIGGATLGLGVERAF
ncbi:MAG TPA: hypothetical protein VKN99_03925 [Polyangia bacterium]|nr:hypothetical protein [Polyangia bacterium]